MSEEKVGIKETKEVIQVAGKLAVKIVELAGDGFQLKDVYDLAMGVLRDAEFKGLVVEAVKGVKQIPAEIKDLDVAEAVELGEIVVKDLVAALKARQEAKEAKEAFQIKKDRRAAETAEAAEKR